MAKKARIGEMRTRIVIKALTAGKDADGFPTKTWENVFDNPTWCLWQNAHGNESFEAMRLGLKELATVTMRYSDRVNVRCRVWYENEPNDDEHAYEIISIDNVKSENAFMEIKLKRLVVA